MSDSQKGTKTKVVKKYRNRKLYDVEQSHYIRLSDIKNYVQEGLKVVVKQDVSKGLPLVDITLLTKLQVLTDEAQRCFAEGRAVDFITEQELDGIILKMKKTSQEVVTIEHPAQSMPNSTVNNQVA